MKHRFVFQLFLADYCPSTVIKPFRKAKLLRLERKMKKTGMTLEQIKAQVTLVSLIFVQLFFDITV